MDFDLMAALKGARQAGIEYSLYDSDFKNSLLKAMGQALLDHYDEIKKVNELDCEAAARHGAAEAMVDRLLLTRARFEEMAGGFFKVAQLPDPLGIISDGRTVLCGLSIVKRTVPLGVVGVIYESRPNVTADIAALCLKSGNACVLRGGSESLNTNRIIHRILCEALEAAEGNPQGLCFIDSPQRDIVELMLRQDDYIDVIIPRGGQALQRLCREKSSIPVITGGFGISHIYVDDSADLPKAAAVVQNAKVQKPSACNAVDTVLVHEGVAAQFVPLLCEALEPYGVELIVHGKAASLVGEYPYVREGSAEDFDQEMLSLRLNLAQVADVDEAIAHLHEHRASHSDAILTDSLAHARRFTRAAGSACVYINASTRFTDGGQFDLGAEVAISTQKLHARGPMALRELTTVQYVCEGDYLVRS